MRSIMHMVTAAAAVMMLMSGCATKRGEVALQVPQRGAMQQQVSAAAKTVFVNSVTDKRIFEVKPANPSTPSLDPNEDQSAATKVRAIGRKRGGFGQAFANFLLKDGQTVETVVSDSVKQAFAEAGYRVLENKSAVTPDTYVVDVSIDKFWSWMNPGFWAITLSTEIGTEMTIKKPDSTQSETLYVKAEDHFQTGVEGNWIEVMQTALKSYVEELKNRI
jgi:hypothetical protein